MLSPRVRSLVSFIFVFALVSVLGMATPGCTKSPSSPTPTNPSPTPPPPAASTCQYTVTPVAFTAHWHGTPPGQFTITTEPGCAWTVRSETPWVTAVIAEGTGTATVAFSVPVYTQEAPRKAPIMVRWPTVTAGQNVWITQEGCIYRLREPASANFTIAGGRGQIDLTLADAASADCGPASFNCPWTVTSPVDWITIVSGSGSGVGRVTFDVAPNTTGAPRSATIAVATQSYVVSQQ